MRFTHKESFVMQNAECRMLFKCGVRNAERGTTSLHFVSLTRIDF